MRAGREPADSGADENSSNTVPRRRGRAGGGPVRYKISPRERLRKESRCHTSERNGEIHIFRSLAGGSHPSGNCGLTLAHQNFSLGRGLTLTSPRSRDGCPAAAATKLEIAAGDR